jgi:hypothetical protein
MVWVLMAPAVIIGAELGLTVHAATCPVPVELRVLTPQEDLPAIQAAISAFELVEPKYVGSACFAVQLTAYAPYDAPNAAQMATAFDSGWNSDALSGIGPEPDLWIPDSTAEVDAVRSSLPPGGPALGQPRPIGFSPVVVAVPHQLVAADSLDSLEQGQTWSTLYADFSHLKIRLALPNPGLSETGLFEIAGLYGAAINASDWRHIEASGNFPLDSQSLLCEASQATGQPAGAANTAYLVSEAAMADYNYSIHDPIEDVCPTPGTVQPLQAFYPTGTAALDFPFTTVNWGGNQSEQRHRYEDDFYHYLTDPAGGGSVLASQGLRSPGCGTGGTIAIQYGIAEFDPSCENPQMPSAATAASALNAFNHALPDANIVTGIDDSGPMKPDLAKITSAVEAVLSPANAPIGAGDHFGIWELPGASGATETPLVNFEPVTPANLDQVREQLTVVAAHSHSADYDMLTDAANHVLYAPLVLPGVGTAPINAVVLLTDGDGYSGHDPDGGTAARVKALFTSPPFGESRIALYIIAFGPAACTPTFVNLGEVTHGGCYPVDGDDPRQLLKQALDQIAGGE